MRKSNSIVRTITFKGDKNVPNEMHYQIEFMTFKKALLKINPRIQYMDVHTELYPYKWFDLRYIYQIPSYWLLLRIFRNSEDKISRQIHRKTSTITLITEILLFITSIIEIIKILNPT